MKFPNFKSKTTSTTETIQTYEVINAQLSLNTRSILGYFTKVEEQLINNLGGGGRFKVGSNIYP